MAKPQGMDVLPAGIILVTSAAFGKQNVMTATRAACIDPDPQTYVLAVHRSRFTYELIRESGEFVLNVAGREQAEAARLAGQQSGRDMDKFGVCGLQTAPAEHLGAPLLVGSSSSIECRVIQSVEIGERTLFIAEVLAVHFNEGIIPLVTFQHQFHELTSPVE